MKKWTLSLVLLLCMALVMPSALAQAAYVPGEITSQLVGSAFASGQMVGGSMMIALDLDEDMLASSEEEKAEIQMVEELLTNAVLSGAAGLVGDALRLELGATYGTEENYAYADAAAELSLDGLTLESSLLPGEKVTATWETLLALCGVSQDEIAMLMSLKTLDIEAVVAELLAQVEPIMQMAAQFAAPYGQTFMDFVATLPIEFEENIPADDVYPAAAERMTIAVTAQDIGRLLTAYADQLEKDASLAPMLDMLLQEIAKENPQGALRSTAELCAQLRALAAQMTDTTPLVFVLAVDAAGMPVYAELYDQTADDSGFYAGVLAYPGEEPNSTVFSFSFYTAAAGGTPIASLSAAVIATVDPADENAMDFVLVMDVMEGEMTLMNMEMSMISEPITTEDGMPGYAQEVAMNMNVDAYGEAASTQTTGAVLQQMTADGGEYVSSMSETNATADGTTAKQIISQEMSISPVEGGFAGAMSELVQMPSEGVTMALYTEFGSWAHQSAALTELALENATNEDVEALITRLSENGMNELTKLMQLLPPQALEMLQ